MSTIAFKQGPGARARFETLHAVIQERILLLDYEPGQRLSEEELAREFGTSRTPIRRVLARLEAEGLVRSVQSVGTLVTDVDIETLVQTYHLRMELAELIGKLDVATETQPVISGMRALQAALEELARSPSARGFARLNVDFLHELLRMTENEPLRDILERLYYRTARIWIKTIGAEDLEAEIAIFAHEVSDILDAVELGDLASVGHIRRVHISKSYHRLKSKAEARLTQ